MVWDASAFAAGEGADRPLTAMELEELEMNAFLDAFESGELDTTPDWEAEDADGAVEVLHPEVLHPGDARGGDEPQPAVRRAVSSVPVADRGPARQRVRSVVDDGARPRRARSESAIVARATLETTVVESPPAEAPAAEPVPAEAPTVERPLPSAVEPPRARPDDEGGAPPGGTRRPPVGRPAPGGSGGAAVAPPTHVEAAPEVADAASPPIPRQDPDRSPAPPSSRAAAPAFPGPIGAPTGPEPQRDPEGVIEAPSPPEPRPTVAGAGGPGRSAAAPVTGRPLATSGATSPTRSTAPVAPDAPAAPEAPAAPAAPGATPMDPAQPDGRAARPAPTAPPEDEAVRGAAIVPAADGPVGRSADRPPAAEPGTDPPPVATPSPIAGSVTRPVAPPPTGRAVPADPEPNVAPRRGRFRRADAPIAPPVARSAEDDPGAEPLVAPEWPPTPEASIDDDAHLPTAPTAPPPAPGSPAAPAPAGTASDRPEPGAAVRPAAAARADRDGGSPSSVVAAPSGDPATGSGVRDVPVADQLSLPPITAPAPAEVPGGVERPVPGRAGLGPSPEVERPATGPAVDGIDPGPPGETSGAMTDAPAARADAPERSLAPAPPTPARAPLSSGPASPAARAEPSVDSSSLPGPVAAGIPEGAPAEPVPVDEVARVAPAATGGAPIAPTPSEAPAAAAVPAPAGDAEGGREAADRPEHARGAPRPPGTNGVVERTPSVTGPPAAGDREAVGAATASLAPPEGDRVTAPPVAPSTASPAPAPVAVAQVEAVAEPEPAVARPLRRALPGPPRRATEPAQHAAAAERFHQVLAAAPTPDPVRGLSSEWDATVADLAEARDGRPPVVGYRSGPATRAALAAAGHEAATVGPVLYLPAPPAAPMPSTAAALGVGGPSAASPTPSGPPVVQGGQTTASVVRHEVVHAVASTGSARFLNDAKVDEEERRARAAAEEAGRNSTGRTESGSQNRREPPTGRPIPSPQPLREAEVRRIVELVERRVLDELERRGRRRPGVL
jgi:hypothetical protein